MFGVRALESAVRRINRINQATRILNRSLRARDLHLKLKLHLPVRSISNTCVVW